MAGAGRCLARESPDQDIDYHEEGATSDLEALWISASSVIAGEIHLCPFEAC